jgi:putative ABC transport system permease protein
VTSRLVLENLRHKPARTLLSVLLIAVPVTLILCLVGLSRGMLEDSIRRARSIGADIFVRPPGSTMFTLGGNMPEQVVTALQQMPHVAIAMGVVNQSAGAISTVATGLDLTKFKAMSGGFTYLHGGPFQQPDDVILDDYYADQQHKRVGDTIQILNSSWHVCGIIEHGMLARIVFPLDVLQRKTGNRGRVSQVYLKVDNPANTDQVIRYVKNQPGWEDYSIWSSEEFLSLLNTSDPGGLRAFTAVVVGIGVVIGFLVAYLSMYMAVLQRTREIGILKSLGASKTFILGIILAEAGAQGVGGAVVGILLSYGARWVIQLLVPASLTMQIVQTWWPVAGGIVLAATMFGALYPGMNAARQDPIEALAYE